MIKQKATFLILALLVVTTGCSSAYFGAMEKLGVPKRRLLVTRVESAKNSQEAAKEQFKSALEKFSEITRFSGGDLEQKFKEISNEYDKSETRAQNLRDRIAAIESVAEALFQEWEEELEQYQNLNLKRASAEELEKTKARYRPMISAMQSSAKKMDPVLLALHDQVLFLKHNLNAMAISSLKSELVTVEGDVAALIKEMEGAIAEAERFISSNQS